MCSQMIRRRIVAHTSVRRMAITMTTSRIVIRRDVVREWPIFATESEVPVAVGVTSVEIRRQGNESVASAAVSAATALAGGMGQMLAVEQGTLWLLALGRPILRSNRIAAHSAKRDRLWGALEKTGVVLPNGRRTEFQIGRSDDVVQFGGVVELTVTGLPLALEVTRCQNAICMGSAGQPLQMGWDGFLSSLDPLPEDSTAFLRAALRQVSRSTFVARSYGQFDDVVVTSEVFAEDDILNPLSAILERNQSAGKNLWR